MDFDSHRMLAENALKKGQAMLDAKDESLYLSLLHFAHVARLHYEYSGNDKQDPAYKENLRKADDFLVLVCRSIGLNDTANFIDSHREV